MHMARILVLLSVGTIATGCTKNNEEKAARFAAEMLLVTQQTTTELNKLAKTNVSKDKMFDDVKALTEGHIRKMSNLGKQFNALPFSSRHAFTGSHAGAIHEKRLEEELGKMKKLAFSLIKEDVSFPLSFDPMSMDRMKKILDGPENWPTETKQVIDAKHGFIYSFMSGVTNFSGTERRKMLGMINQLRDKALEGDPKATAELNGLLKETLNMYPKDEAMGQYNLGILYTDLGEKKKAEKWFSRAASQGLVQADKKLKELRANDGG